MEGFAPIHVCAEFEDENKLWTSSSIQSQKERALGILQSDSARPVDQKGNLTKIAHDNHTVRIRDVIRLLITHGADVNALSKKNMLAIDIALENRCEEMLMELLPALDRASAQAEGSETPQDWQGRKPRRFFHEAYKTIRSRHLIDFLEQELKAEKQMGSKLRHAHDLLSLREFITIEQLPGIGVDFTPTAISSSEDFLDVLVKWGYASLLEKLGGTVKDSSWVNGVINPEQEREYLIQPFLLTACHSRLPNLDVIKVLIEKFGADVNVQVPLRKHQSGHFVYPLGSTPLHILARGTCWWQADAIKYMLSKGADTSLLNVNGETALHVAVSNINSENLYCRRTTQILLGNGADPNAIDYTGSTCLNKAMHDLELIKTLINVGADIALGSKPILLSAITAQDLHTIRILIECGADCNTRQTRSNFDLPFDSCKATLLQHEFFAVHYAASWRFDTPSFRNTAIEIVSCLLGGGADPFLQFREDATILHHILSYTGILRPFLQIPGLNIEQRDPNGRTLLLAACIGSRGTDSPTNFQCDMYDHMPLRKRIEEGTKCDPTAALTLFEMGANLTARDNKGNNVLHLLSLSNPHNADEFQKTFSLFLDKAPFLVTQKNETGYTPYHYAVQERRVWTARALLKASANPVEPDPEGNTALHHLSSSLCNEGRDYWGPLIQDFLDLGIDINAQNHKRESLLFNYFAAECSTTASHDCVEFGSQAPKHFSLLKEAGADVNVVNNEGEGLLHVVAKRLSSADFMRRSEGKDTVDTFKFLMEMGLDPQMEDRNQRSSLDVAAAYGSTGILELFQRKVGQTLISEVSVSSDADSDEN